MRGQIVFFGMMLGILVIVLALGLAPTVKQFTDAARNETDAVGGQGLNCTNPALSDYDKGACTITDLSLPYFIGGLVLIGGIILVSKVIIENVA